MLLLKNIKELIGIDQNVFDYQRLDKLEDAWLLIEGEKIAAFGSMNNALPEAQEVIDVAQGSVLPAWCDSHTHLVFAGSRENEFVDRIKGLSYEEIAERGGGILNSAKKLADTSFEDLYHSAKKKLKQLASLGTGLVEIKSGYGLSVEAELKILRVAQALKEDSLVEIKTTFLGAHAIPMAYRSDRRGYLDLIIKEMLPTIAKEGLADYIDVFCEKVAFSPDETDEILKAGLEFGLKPKIHTNQFNSMGGIEVAIANGAISVDHLEVLNDEEIRKLSNSNVIPTLLPSAPFFLGDAFPPARKMIAAGLQPALASDYNPGSSPSYNMNLVISLACIKMKMSPEEAINAATIMGAKALEMEADYGSIKRGKMANLIVTEPIPSVNYLPYHFGEAPISSIFLKGKLI